MIIRLKLYDWLKNIWNKKYNYISNKNININEFQKELKDINGLENEPSIKLNKIKGNNINNNSQEKVDNITQVNETSITNDINYSINGEDMRDNLEEG